MKRNSLRFQMITAGVVIAACGVVGERRAFAAGDQTVVGAGNATAIATSSKSADVAASRQYLVNQALSMKTASLYGHTLDILTNSKHCIAHRAGLTDTQKNGIVQALLDQGLVAPHAGDSILGGIKAGVFPPVVNDGSDCPTNPQEFTSAPGSDNGGHHSYPGGLAIHEANNEAAAVNWAASYRGSFGGSTSAGLTAADHTPNITAANSAVTINQDFMIAAAIWHDWAKIQVFQWNADGTEFIELKFGGAGMNDNYGKAGSSVTGGHHIISVAETMARGLPPDFIITQASAHAAPTLGNEFEVVNWIRAAAMIAQLDPVAAGYLVKDASGNLRLPAFRNLGDVNLLAANQTNVLVEYQLHNLSDADFVFSIPAVGEMDVILPQIASQFGYSSTDTSIYNNKFRNVVYSHLTAERLHMIYGNRGLAGVVAEITKLKNAGLI